MWRHDGKNTYYGVFGADCCGNRDNNSDSKYSNQGNYGYYQSQNAKRASSQKRHMVISIFLLCNSLILMSIGAGSIRAIKGGLDKVFKIRDRLHRICRQILR